MKTRLRLLPIAIATLVLVLGVKVGGLWTGLYQTVTPSFAQEAAPVAGEPRPDPATGETAQATPPVPAGGDAAQAAGGGKGKAKPGGLPDDPTLLTQAEIDLLQKLADRRAELEKWAGEIEMREGLLKAAEQRIDRKVTELREIQVKIQGMLKTYEKEQEDKLKSLVKIYESMKPKEAAPIFMELEMDVLLDVIERMREAKAAAIIARLEPARAKEVTIELADRRKMGADARKKAASDDDRPPPPSAGAPAASAPGNG